MGDLVFELDWLPSKKHGIRSLKGSNRRTQPFSGPLEFMAKMLEHKGWIEFNEATKTFDTRLIDPSNINDILPIEKWINYHKHSAVPLRLFRKPWEGLLEAA